MRAHLFEAKRNNRAKLTKFRLQHLFKIISMHKLFTQRTINLWFDVQRGRQVCIHTSPTTREKEKWRKTHSFNRSKHAAYLWINNTHKYMESVEKYMGYSMPLAFDPFTKIDVECYVAVLCSSSSHFCTTIIIATIPQFSCVSVCFIKDVQLHSLRLRLYVNL